jgi:two-component system response regulator ArlR
LRNSGHKNGFPFVRVKGMYVKMKCYRILIIEDERQIARFVELELNHEGYQVELATDGREGLRKMDQSHYDLIILDIMLPGLNGIEVCRRIRQNSTIPIIMLTAKDDVASKVMGLDVGADDYLTKPFAIEELLARIRVIARRENQQTLSKITVADLSLDLTAYQVFRAGKTVDLTKKEFELLHYLVRNQGVVLSREQIMGQVWGYDYFGDTNNVDVYIKYLRRKIDDPYEKKLIHTVRGFGYVIKDETP